MCCLDFVLTITMIYTAIIIFVFSNVDWNPDPFIISLTETTVTCCTKPSKGWLGIMSSCKSRDSFKLSVFLRVREKPPVLFGITIKFSLRIEYEPEVRGRNVAGPLAPRVCRRTCRSQVLLNSFPDLSPACWKRAGNKIKETRALLPVSTTIYSQTPQRNKQTNKSKQNKNREKQNKTDKCCPYPKGM